MKLKVVDFFVGWVFFSAWFLARADEELKKEWVQELRHSRQRYKRSTRHR